MSITPYCSKNNLMTEFTIYVEINSEIILNKKNTTNIRVLTLAESRGVKGDRKTMITSWLDYQIATRSSSWYQSKSSLTAFFNVFGSKLIKKMAHQRGSGLYTKKQGTDLLCKCDQHIPVLIFSFYKQNLHYNFGILFHIPKNPQKSA